MAQRSFPVVAAVTAAALVAGLLGLLAWGVLRAGQARAGSGASTGSGAAVNAEGGPAAIKPRPAPDLQLRPFDTPNTLWKLSDQRGKRVVINFWASWCAPCRSEAAALEAASREYRPQGIVLVGANLWDDDDAARRFLDEFGIDYLNGKDAAGTAGVDYGVTGIPETFLVDERGQLVRRWVGPITRGQLDGLVAP